MTSRPDVNPARFLPRSRGRPLMPKVEGNVGCAPAQAERTREGLLSLLAARTRARRAMAGRPAPLPTASTKAERTTTPRCALRRRACATRHLPLPPIPAPSWQPLLPSPHSQRVVGWGLQLPACSAAPAHGHCVPPPSWPGETLLPPPPPPPPPLNKPESGGTGGRVEGGVWGKEGLCRRGAFRCARHGRAGGSRSAGSVPPRVSPL